MKQWKELNGYFILNLTLGTHFNISISEFWMTKRRKRREESTKANRSESAWGWWNRMNKIHNYYYYYYYEHCLIVIVILQPFLAAVSDENTKKNVIQLWVTAIGMALSIKSIVWRLLTFHFQYKFFIFHL